MSEIKPLASQVRSATSSKLLDTTKPIARASVCKARISSPSGTLSFLFSLPVEKSASAHTRSIVLRRALSWRKGAPLQYVCTSRTSASAVPNDSAVLDLHQVWSMSDVEELNGCRYVCKTNTCWYHNPLYPCSSFSKDFPCAYRHAENT